MKLVQLFLSWLPCISGVPKYKMSPPVNFSMFQYPSVASTTVVDPSAMWGQWDGWGVSLCWWANLLGHSDLLADAIFSKKTVHMAGVDLPGLGFNIARYNAGGTTWTKYGDASVEIINIPKFKQIQGFWRDWGSDDPSSSSWNWAADANQVAMLKKAKARGANQLELFSNSPIWWQLKNHNPAGSDLGIFDNLDSWNYGNHSKYLAIIAQEAVKRWGIEFTSVEPFNEPISDWWQANNGQEGCHFAHSTQSMTIAHMNEELKMRQLETVVLTASDENEYDEATSTWKSFDSATQAMVGKVNTHGYQGTGGRRDLLYDAVKGKRLWDSEYGDGDGSGMSMAAVINLDFRWLHNVGWCYWQVADNTAGWGFFLMDSDAGLIRRINTKFFVMAQYSRHIRPGMTIVDGGSANTVAAYDAAARKLVLVSATYSEAHTLTYDLSKFQSAAGPITYWTTVTSDDGDRYVRRTNVALDGKKFTLQLAANSVVTAEVENVHAVTELVV